MTALVLKFTRKSGEGHRGNWTGKAKRWERTMWTMRSHHWAVLNHWRLRGVWWAVKECVQICLLAQFLLHFIHPFNEYLLNTLSGPDTVQNAEDTMYLGLAWRQWFIVSSCLQFSLLWNFFFLLSNWHMLHNICSMLYAMLYAPDCAKHLAQLPHHPHNSSIVEGIITSPFYRWGNWLKKASDLSKATLS